MLKTKFSTNKIKIYEANAQLPKIRDFKSNDDLKPLIDLIGKWRFYLGVKEELTQEEIFMNVTFIRENFNELNLTDINQAINLSLKGSLDVDTRHFQSFTPLYISSILIAYKKYKSSFIVSIRKEIAKLESVPKKITDKERIDSTKANLRSMYQSREDESFADYGSVVYNFIKKNNLVVFTKVLVDEALRHAEKELKLKARDSLYKNAAQNVFSKNKNEKESREAYKRSCARDYVVKKWLLSINDMEKFLENLTIDMI